MVHFYRVTYIEREGGFVHEVIQAQNLAAAKRLAAERFDDVKSVRRIHAWAKIIVGVFLILAAIIALCLR